MRVRNALHRTIASTGLLAAVLLLAVAFWPWGQGSTRAALNPTPEPQPVFTPDQLEFFEAKIRPILVERCFECHSHKAKKLKSGLHLDSRAGLLTGGERGPAAVAGKPAESRLVKGISYADPNFQMPPKAKLADDQIAALGKWVEMGLPWPVEAEPMGAVKGPKEFDLKQRMTEHWSWKALSNPTPPSVNNSDWPAGDIDRFILARLQAAGLKPAADADRPVLIRRLYFDLIGLPPTPAQIDAFVNDRSGQALEKVVDELLQSPHFGERWGRHWLDMVRYAESRGHEFDPDAANAFEYRDYVIRALNADVPYNQFVVEHLAGDLLDKPRLHPERGFNESILGTGFWFLGEQVHSPVDIRKDETDRYDNMVDVMTKTFLGLTVACARCHDHKFDAISTKDYYALVGFLQSSDYRQVRYQTLETEKQIAGELRRLRELHTPAIARAFGAALASGAEETARYAAAARSLFSAPTSDKHAAADILFDDFEKETYEGWTVEGTAFGSGPIAQKDMPAYQGKVGAHGVRLVNSHNVRDNKSNVIGGDNHVGRMTSRQFKIERDYISLLIGGGAHEGKTCLQVLIDDKPVASITGRNANKMSPAQIDLRNHRGAAARIRIIDDHREGWGNIGVDHIVFTDKPVGAARPAPGEWRANWTADDPAIQALARDQKLDAARLAAWATQLAGARKNPSDPLYGLAELIGGGAPASLTSRYAVPAAVNAPRIMVDFSRLDQGQWIEDGFSFGAGPIRLGEPKLSGDTNRPIESIGFPGGAERDPVFSGLKLAPGTGVDPGVVGQRNRSGRTVRSPTFELTSGRIYYLVRGRLAVLAMVDSHRMINGPLHGAVARDINSEPADQWRWVEHNLSAYAGHRIHVEFSAVDEADGAIARIVQVEQGQSPPVIPGSHNPLIAAAYTTAAKAQPSEAVERSVQSLTALLGQAAARLSQSTLPKSDQSEAWSQLADWMVRNASLFIAANSPQAAKLSQAAQPYTQALGPLKSSIPSASRTAMAMLDGSAENEPVLIRGGYNTPGQIVPRRFLEALGGLDKPITGPGSGRLQLARQIIDPANPYVSRVIVNRLWHHLFGRGIVPSVDNLGVLGQGPSHPELLDHLASRFIADGWSLKRAIRSIVLSRTYRMASRTDQAVDEKDPQNLLLHRMPIKRLQGEVIRDSVLAISGRLDRTLYGPSVPNHLTEFMDGRGRPGGGPMDGNGRRSIYLAIRRNFLSPMMLAFDYPTPFSSVGQRTVSNVPAQALILMNDPFIQQQAAVWAARVLAEKDLSVDERINLMYRQAFGRPATEAERKDAAEFLTQQGAALGLKPAEIAGAKAPWADLAHVLWNVKEFVYIP